MITITIEVSEKPDGGIRFAGEIAEHGNPTKTERIAVEHIRQFISSPMTIDLSTGVLTSRAADN